MDEQLKLVRLDSKYCDYLRKYDSRVPYNFNKKELRPFVGVLFMVNGCKYFAPLSSPKPKHLKMKNTIDFLKLKSGQLGAINFNNMLPVTDDNVIMLDLESDSMCKEDMQYKKLLKEQLFWLNRNIDKLYFKSKFLYDNYVEGLLDKNVMDRCCNFKLLEEKCIIYNRKMVEVS